MTGAIGLTEDASPATPAAGVVAIYAKTDGKVYKKDDTGTESELGAGGSATLDQGQVLARSASGTGAASGHSVGTGLKLSNGALFVDPLFHGALALELSEDRGVAIIAGPDGNGIYDGFGALTYVDVAGATNLDTTTVPGALLPSVTIGADQSTTGFAVSGGASSGFPATNAFDNSTATTWLSSQTAGGINGAAYVGQNFGGGNAKNIVSASIQQGSTTLAETSYGLNSIKIQYSDNGTVWTDVPGSPFSLTKAGGMPGPVQTKSWPSQGAHQYWRLLANDGLGGSQSWVVCEVTFNVAGTPNNVTVESSEIALQEQPDWCQIIAFLDLGSGALNSDIKLSASRNDGGAYELTTLGEKYTRADGSVVVDSGIVDLTALAAGTVGKWKFQTANNRDGVQLLAAGIIFGTYG